VITTSQQNTILLADRPDARLGVIKCVDVILAALQSAFAQENLFNGGNPYRFIREDPKASRVWVCDPQSRLTERDGNRMMVMVSRGDYLPGEMHLYNVSASNFSDKTSHMDLASTSLYVQCESGTKMQSEILASTVYNILKLFRRQLMEEFDIHDLKLTSISVPTQQRDVPGSPWVTVVTGKLAVQEDSSTLELANHFNKIEIDQQILRNLNEATEVDTELPLYQPGQLNAAAVASQAAVPGSMVAGSIVTCSMVAGSMVAGSNIVSQLVEQDFPVQPIIGG